MHQDPVSGYPPTPGLPATEHPGGRHGRRRRGRGWAFGAVLLTVAVVAGVLFADGRLDPILDLLGAGRSPSETAEPTAAPGEVDLRPLFEELNTALARQDRASFFAHVTGDAVGPLELWWDNMDLLGWSTAAIVYASTEDRQVSAPAGEIEVFLGSDMGYPQRQRDSQAITTTGFPYEAMVDVTGPEPMITGWAAAHSVRPWDVAPLAVVVGEGVVVAGLPEERDYLEGLVPVAEEASAWTRSDYVLQRGQAPPSAGFLVFGTADPATFESWFRGEAAEPWVMEPAAIAVPGSLPRADTPGLDPRLATGDWPSGGFVSIGPAGLGPDDAVAGLLVHEFAHVVQSVDTPVRTVSPPLTTLEGWADFQLLRFANGGEYPSSGPVAEYVRSCVSGPPVVPTDTDLRSADSRCAYAVASTLFAYAELSGIPAIDLIDEGARHGLSPFDAAQRLGVPMSEDDWAAWVLATFG